MIIDAFLYAGERDMLDLRLRTLGGVVDAFVAVVCEYTHQGEPADLEEIAWSFYRARESFYSACPSGAAVAMEYFCPDMTGWPEGARGGAGTPLYQKIERQHRDACLAAARTITTDPDAVILVSDVDEIPDAGIVRRFAEADYSRNGDYFTFAKFPWVAFGMRFHSTALDLLHPQQPWWGTTLSLLKDCQPQAMRDARTTIGSPGQSILPIPMNDNMGQHASVHLSWFGTDDERATKLATFSHAEIAARGDDPKEWRATRRHANGEQLIPCEFPGDLWWPAPLVDGSFNIPKEWL